MFEGIVEEFRHWTQEHVEQAEAILTERSRTPLDAAAIVAQFTALRQEVNLQTKNSRSQLEQNAQALDQLARAAQTMREQHQRLREENTAALDDKLRPFVKGLVDARDALALAERNVRKIQDSLRAPELATPPEPPEDIGSVPSGALTPPLWARMLGLGGWLRAAAARSQTGAPDMYRQHLQAWAVEQQNTLARQQEQNAAFRQAIESILTGYVMSLERLDRTLEDLGVVPIDCVGEPFDAETMEAVEVVRDPGRITTEVLEEVRPGYHWRDVLFRCAQVRVARP